MTLSVQAMPGKVVIVREHDGNRDMVLMAVAEARRLARMLESACLVAEEARSN